MWYLVEDFLEQSWVMKLFILLGWLCIGIMVSAFISNGYTLIGKAMEEQPVQELME